MTRALAPLAALLLAALVACPSLDTRERDPFPVPQAGVAVAPDPRATAAALSILERGGNAADAAVAAALALAVARPGVAPLGGGGVALWVAVDPEEEPRLLDFREGVPAAFPPLSAARDGIAPAPRVAPGLAVGVPAAWIGLHAFQRGVGRLSFAEVARPAIELARVGVLPDRELLERLTSDLAFVQALLRLGPLPVEGVLYRQPSLQRFLEDLASRGPAALASGQRAEALCRAVAAQGGVLQRSDLGDYRPLWTPVLAGWFRGLEILTAPPPTLGGPLVLESLLVLDGFPLDAETERAKQGAAGMGLEPSAEKRGLSARAVHWCIEALRVASKDVHAVVRAKDPVGELAARLLPEHVVSERVFIGESAHAGVPWVDPGAADAAGESAIVVLDRGGNAVALALGLGPRFGAGIFVPETGFFVNGALAPFLAPDADPALVARLAPGERPPTWRTPLVAREGGASVAWVLAAAGSMRAPQALLQVFLRTEVHGQALDAALGAPRLAPVERGLECEPGWDAALLSGLGGRGHPTQTVAGDYGSVLAICALPIESPVGGSDPRTPGSAGFERAPKR